MSLYKYSLNDFDTICTNFIELDQEIINKINELAKKVGAPNYNRTPNFKKNKNNWSDLRNFKNTTLQKNTEGIEAKIDEIRIRLNKLTNKNYNDLSKEIITYIKKEIENDDTILNKVGKSIFEVGSMNSFWSKLYAKLYNDLIVAFPIMKNICEENFNHFLDEFDTIIHIKSDDYNDLCNNNKINGKRRALSSFFVNLTLYNIISINDIYTLINKLIDKIKNNDDEDYLFINDEIVENLCIIIKNGYVELEKYDKWNDLMDNIISFSDTKCNYLSTKSSFKFLDLLDDIE